jgi:hypothetical protein
MSKRRGEKEAAMVQQQDRLTRVVKLAYELAQTGKFEDVAAVERELVTLGYEEETSSLKSPGLRVVIDEVCATGRERDAPTWHQHTAY